jgi:glucokinase
VAALGEATYGAGKGYNNVLYITVGSGVGGGLVINQQIYHGTIPGEIEIGHIQMDRSGTTLQSRCSGWAVDEKIRHKINADSNGLLAKLIGNETSSEASFLKERWKPMTKRQNKYLKKRPTISPSAFHMQYISCTRK